MKEGGTNSIKTFSIPEIKTVNKDNSYIEITEKMKSTLKSELKSQGYEYLDKDADINIYGTLLQFKEGNATARYFAGIYGAGKDEMTFNFSIKNDNGEELINGNVSGQIKTGAWGGETKEICQKIAKDIAMKLKEYKI
ncbi:DUF4410 domain-containing protein [Zunongwangia sp.]|uniref:DUF4410 domain-containing protein n=1 Tax=Zunongwangia sp. TaxID=1965325 RepID=UPI003AA9B83D